MSTTMAPMPTTVVAAMPSPVASEPAMTHMAAKPSMTTVPYKPSVTTVATKATMPIAQVPSVPAAEVEAERGIVTAIAAIAAVIACRVGIRV